MSDDSLTERISHVIEQYSLEGIHRTGTEVDRLSAHNLATAIATLGVEPELDSFEFQRLVPGVSKFEFGGLSISGVPLYDCLYTSTTGITGTLGSLGSTADIGVVMTLPFDSSESAQALMAARKAGVHKAIIAVTDERLPDSGPALLNAEHFRDPFGPPVLQVANRYWTEIQQACKQSSLATVVAEANYQTSDAFNVQAKVAGKDLSLDPLVIMTPRSGWWFNASERGGGIAAWLEILRAVALNQPNRACIFTANTGHELGHIGLDHYLQQNRSLVENARAWMHLGANFAAKHGKSVRLQYSSELMRELVTQHRGQLAPDVETPLTARPFGEARNIYDKGGRFFSILGGNGLFHHPEDRWPDAVDVALTCQWVKVLTRVARALTAA